MLLSTKLYKQLILNCVEKTEIKHININEKLVIWKFIENCNNYEIN